MRVQSCCSARIVCRRDSLRSSRTVEVDRRLHRAMECSVCAGRMNASESCSSTLTDGSTSIMTMPVRRLASLLSRLERPTTSNYGIEIPLELQAGATSRMQ
ncbi:MAG: hypothetical protein ACI841_001998 [Planctomycetota bacterium]|jgi:hypothetical protein